MNLNSAAKILAKKLNDKKLPHLFLLRFRSNELNYNQIVTSFNREFFGADFNNHPDSYVLKIDEDDKLYKVDSKNFNYFLKYINYRPVNIHHKFVYIEDAHLISEVLLNKLLKTFEELESYLTIFLLIPDQNQILDTIKSRSLEIFINDAAALKYTPEIENLDYFKILNELKKDQIDEVSMLDKIINSKITNELNYHELTTLFDSLKSFHRSHIFHSSDSAKIASMLP